MSAVAKPRFTLGEYLARERVEVTKSEFYRGEIFAMAGGSIRHNRICANLIINLGRRLQGSTCQVTTSDQRIRIPAVDLSTYPDISIICGEPQPDTADTQAIVNPRVIFEVLSKSTEGYDRGKKFDFYRELDSLQEFMLVSQEEPHVERNVRQPNGSWLLTVFKGMDSELVFSSLSISLPFAEIYDRVEFGREEEGAQ